MRFDSGVRIIACEGVNSVFGGSPKAPASIDEGAVEKVSCLEYNEVWAYT